MFFGLTNSPATFQRMMNTIFRNEVTQGWMSVYMDDIAIHTARRDNETEEAHQMRHQNYIHIMLDRLEYHDLFLKPEKCEFEKEEIDYLGVVVGRNQLRMDPKKIQGVQGWETPCSPTDI
jgi:hypothetical protein